MQVKPGFYFIKSKLSASNHELYLDIEHPNTPVEGNSLIINDFDGSISQIWYWDANGYIYNLATHAKPLVVDGL